MTDYVILQATNESGTIFQVLGQQEAASAQAAISKFSEEAGIYAAVPKRSWLVTKVEIETTTRRKTVPL